MSLEWICGSLGILAKIIMIYPNPQMHFSCGIQGHTSGDAAGLLYGMAQRHLVSIASTMWLFTLVALDGIPGVIIVH